MAAVKNRKEKDFFGSKLKNEGDTTRLKAKNETKNNKNRSNVFFNPFHPRLIDSNSTVMHELQNRILSTTPFGMKPLF